MNPPRHTTIDPKEAAALWKSAAEESYRSWTKMKNEYLELRGLIDSIASHPGDVNSWFDKINTLEQWLKTHPVKDTQ
jgi:hypothetical protein